MSEQQEGFTAWAIIELFGRQQIAGMVSEQSIGGASFVRVDVPEVDSQPAYTKLYGSGAIYCLTPVDEALARRAAQAMRVRPVQAYSLPEPRYSDAQDEDDDPDEEYGF